MLRVAFLNLWHVFERRLEPKQMSSRQAAAGAAVGAAVGAGAAALPPSCC